MQTIELSCLKPKKKSSMTAGHFKSASSVSATNLTMTTSLTCEPNWSKTNDRSMVKVSGYRSTIVKKIITDCSRISSQRCKRKRGSFWWLTKKCNSAGSPNTNSNPSALKWRIPSMKNSSVQRTGTSISRPSMRHWIGSDRTKALRRWRTSLHSLAIFKSYPSRSKIRVVSLKREANHMACSKSLSSCFKGIFNKTVKPSVLKPSRQPKNTWLEWTKSIKVSASQAWIWARAWR